MMEDKLKRCGHCGSEARRGKTSPYDPYIWCSKCKISTGMCFSYSEALEKWNTRDYSHLTLDDEKLFLLLEKELNEYINRIDFMDLATSIASKSSELIKVKE